MAREGEAGICTGIPGSYLNFLKRPNQVHCLHHSPSRQVAPRKTHALLTLQVGLAQNACPLPCGGRHPNGSDRQRPDSGEQPSAQNPRPILYHSWRN